MIELYIDTETKTCYECKNEYPATEEYFYKQKYSSKEKGVHYRLSNPCKTCRKATQRKYKEANKDELNKRNYEYFLEHKDHLYSLRDKWMKENKEYMRKYQREYLRTNKDKVKSYQQKRFSNKAHEINKQEWEDCKTYFEHSCAYCGIIETEAKEKLGQNLHKEHLNNNGANNLSNCVPACRICNSRKWEFPFEEWYNEENPIYDLNRKNKIFKWINEDYKLYIQLNQSKITNTK